MKVSHFIASMLVLIFIALAWRFLLPLLLIGVSLLMWFLLFGFCKGLAQGFYEMTKGEDAL